MSRLIDEVYCWVGIDPADDSEGVCAVLLGDTWMPLIAADKARLADLRPLAVTIRRQENKALRLIRLTTREIVEEMP